MYSDNALLSNKLWYFWFVFNFVVIPEPRKNVDKNADSYPIKPHYLEFVLNKG